jgi:hypothetical protein
LKREILKRTYDLNYILIAIRGTLKDFQLAYFLNKSSLFFLKRVENDITYNTTDSILSFATFSDTEADHKKDSFLIKNKTNYNSTIPNNNLFFQHSINKSIFLIPELKAFDYLLKLEGVWHKEELTYIKKYLRSINNIESESSVDITKIKSINNLVF